jgi:hypothetical protein
MLAQEAGLVGASCFWSITRVMNSTLALTSNKPNAGNGGSKRDFPDVIGIRPDCGNVNHSHTLHYRQAFTGEWGIDLHKTDTTTTFLTAIGPKR